MPLTPDERFAMEMAKIYRRKGFNVMPSAMPAGTDVRKKPMYAHAEEYQWVKMFPGEWFTEERWEKRPTTNIQVMTGRMPWRLLVIDLDGDEARYIFKQWGRCPDTWVVHREDGASWHLWFRLPPDYPKPLPKRFLWQGAGKHEGIERLCDRSLIVAPPSFHVVHRESRYRFLDKRHSPQGMGMPADCPRWVLDRRPIEPEVKATTFVPAAPKVTTRSCSPETFMDRNELLDRIPDKIAVARDWGIRFTGRVSPTGWAECHAISRPDENPSAAMHVATGVYTDRSDAAAISFLDAMVATGNALDFSDACSRLMNHVR